MDLSVLDIFKIGVGPSSSHTMGPMNAACTFAEDLAGLGLVERTARGTAAVIRSGAFAEDLAGLGLLERTARVGAQLYGSLALTGKGHCTDRAVLLGLAGHRPHTVDPAAIDPTLEEIRARGR